MSESGEFGHPSASSQTASDTPVPFSLGIVRFFPQGSTTARLFLAKGQMVPKTGRSREVAQLLQKETLADLIAAHKGFRGAELRKEAKNVTVLKDMGVHGQRRGGDNLNRLSIGDPIPVKPIHWSAVEQRKNDAVRAQHL